MRRSITVLLLVLVGALASASPAAAGAIPPPPGGHGTLYTAPPSWAVKARTHVKIVNHVAKLVSTTGLSATTIKNTKAAIAKFNKLPLAVRKLAGATPKPFAHLSLSLGVSPNDTHGGTVLRECLAGSFASLQWWGVYIKLSECGTQWLKSLGDGATAITAGVAALSAIIPGGQIVAALSGFSAASIAIISWMLGFVDTYYCGGAGVSLNLSWSFPAYVGC